MLWLMFHKRFYEINKYKTENQTFHGNEMLLLLQNDNR